MIIKYMGDSVLRTKSKINSIYWMGNIDVISIYRCHHEENIDMISILRQPKNDVIRCDNENWSGEIRCGKRHKNLISPVRKDVALPTSLQMRESKWFHYNFSHL